MVTFTYSQSCSELSDSFTSYKEATGVIKSTDFFFIDSCDTSKSSWIKEASFYSCDGDLGYFILKTSKQSYIHKNVPNYLWREFKKAESFGGFYSRKIKGKYQLNI